jgi:hypothetical protein
MAADLIYDYRHRRGFSRPFATTGSIAPKRQSEISSKAPRFALLTAIINAAILYGSLYPLESRGVKLSILLPSWAATPGRGNFALHPAWLARILIAIAANTSGYGFSS